MAVYSDLKLVVNQVNGVWRTKHGELKRYQQAATGIAKAFNRFAIEYEHKLRNDQAYMLAKKAADESCRFRQY